VFFSCRIPVDEVLQPLHLQAADEPQQRLAPGHESNASLPALVPAEEVLSEARLADSDEDDGAAESSKQEIMNSGKLVINGIEGSVALPGYDLGLMSRNSMKESLENAVSSFRSKSTVRQRARRVDNGFA
jgi:hypothetical protein